MAWPIIRIDLSERSRDFQTIALQPGFPVLDRFSANAGIIRHWLGRFAADAQWDAQTVRYFWRDDDVAAPPTDVAPATKLELQRLLSAEVEALKAKLKQAVVKTAGDRALLAILQQRLDRAIAGEAVEPGMFFKVKVQGRWKLLWCWGYDPRRSKNGKMNICPNDACQLAYFDQPDLRHRCPRCGTKVATSRLGRVLAMVACLLLVCTAGYIGWDRAGRPGFPAAKVRFEVVDAVSGKPIPGVSVKQSSASETRGMYSAEAVVDWEFLNGRAESLKVSAAGYRSATWDPPGGRLPTGTQRIELRGDCDLTGLVIEAETDRPIPFASIQMPQSGREGTADDVGLFLLPAVPSGSVELQASASGYQTKRVTADLKPGRSPDVLIALSGAAMADGAVEDAFTKKPVANATIKLAGGSTEWKSDDAGAFHCDPLPGTTCRFEVAAPGYFTREFDRPLAPTGRTDLRFLLRPDLTSLDGQVVDSSGSPIPAANVQLVGQDLTARTSAQGTFRMSGVRRGTALVEVSAEGYATQTAKLEAAADGKSQRIVLSGPANLTGLVQDAASNSPVKDAEIQVAEGRWKAVTDAQGRFELAGLPAGSSSLKVIGRGYQASVTQTELKPGQNSLQFELQGGTVLSGTVTSAFDQQPLAGAIVQLEGVESPASTDIQGRFRFEGVVPGKLVLQVTADGFQPESMTREVSANEENSAPVELRGSATLAGRVVAADTGQPISRAELAVVGSERKVVADEQGQFRQENCPARSIQMQVGAKGYLTEHVEADLGLPAAAPLLIRLKTPYSAKGQVVDAGTSHPVPGARVSIGGRDDSVVTGDDGRFELTTAQSATYEFRVAAASYPPQSLVVRSDAGEAQAAAKTAAAPFFKLPLQRDAEGAKTVADVAAAEGDTAARIAGRDPLDVEFFGVHAHAANVGFVVDCSGSMSGLRLERTKLELLQSVLNLNPKQKYYVSFFDDSPLLMFDGQKEPVVASPVNKVRTYKWMKTVNGGGGTNPPPALKAVADMNPQAIFLLSDGNFNPLEEDLYGQFAEKKIKVNSLAFEDESGRKELERIANQTGGTYRFIPKTDIPDLFELSLVSRLFDQLLQQWLDPKTAADLARDAHEALIEFCDGHDFGPGTTATDLDRRHARSAWQRWWVENKLVPQAVKRDEAKLLKDLGNADYWWRWAGIDALSQKGGQDGSVFVPRLRDAECGVRQAARRALVKLAGDEDYGPQEDADSSKLAEAFEKWTGWLHRLRYIAGLNKKPDDMLVNDFESSDLKTRRAAVQVAADRDRFQLPEKLIAVLADPDFAIRQSAHEALVKAAGKDLGPKDCSNRSVCADAAKEWQTWYGGKLEKEAEKTLRLAESFDANHRTDAAREWFQRVIEKFPGTEAAKRAAARLKSL